MGMPGSPTEGGQVGLCRLQVVPIICLAIALPLWSIDSQSDSSDFGGFSRRTFTELHDAGVVSRARLGSEATVSPTQIFVPSDKSLKHSWICMPDMGRRTDAKSNCSRLVTDRSRIRLGGRCVNRRNIQVKEMISL